jgi:hypothetical protein
MQSLHDLRRLAAGERTRHPWIVPFGKACQEQPLSFLALGAAQRFEGVQIEVREIRRATHRSRKAVEKSLKLWRARRSRHVGIPCWPLA